MSKNSYSYFNPKSPRILNLPTDCNQEGNAALIQVVYKLSDGSSFPLCLSDVQEHLSSWNCKLL